mgnify:CR=1 FL=1
MVTVLVSRTRRFSRLLSASCSLTVCGDSKRSCSCFINNLFSISHSTINDHINILKIPDDNISFIGGGINREFDDLNIYKNADLQKLNDLENEKFILFIGGDDFRKNIPRLKKIKPYLEIIFSSFNLSWQIIFRQFFGLDTLFMDFSIF